VDNYYIYYIRNGQIFYERTTGTEQRAKERCAELRLWTNVTDALYTVNKSIKGAFY
jgi:hypothetical protein